jgi:succinate dehydrogenase/fumarate reductase iron-sulfur protein
MHKDLTVKIRRFDPKMGTPVHFETFKVGREDRMNVLDVINKIQSTIDPSLAFRYSCRVGMCGTCAMRVNGRNRWTCRTSVEELGENILVIEPLPHYPVIRDLVVDMQPFFEDQRKIIPHFVPAKPDREDFTKISCDSRERGEIDQHIECITCGSCYGECSLVETNKDYVGPAAINRAFTLVADSRDSLTVRKCVRKGSPLLRPYRN